MKELQIIKNGEIKKLQCIKFDGTYESFKEIYCAIKNRMMLLIARYRKFMNDSYSNCDVIDYDDGRYTYTKREVEDVWTSKNSKDAWNMIYYLIPLVIEDIHNHRIDFKTILYNDYLIIDKDDLSRLYVGNESFIEEFGLEVKPK